MGLLKTVTQGNSTQDTGIVAKLVILIGFAKAAGSLTKRRTSNGVRVVVCGSVRTEAKKLNALSVPVAMTGSWALSCRSLFCCFYGVVFGHVSDGSRRHFGNHFRSMFDTFFDQKSSRLFNRFFIDFWMDFQRLNP